MNLKTFSLASLPLIVAPLISLTATPAKAVSLNSQPQLSSKLLLASNSHNPVLISDRYDGDRNDYRWHRDRDDNRRRGDRDDQWRHDRDDYRWHRDSDNYRRYRDRDSAGVIIRF